VSRGWELATAPGAMVSWDYNVGWGVRASLSGYPNFDPIQGGPFRSWVNADKWYHRDNSGMPTPGGFVSNIESDRWGFVVGRDADTRYDVHGAQQGNVALNDGSVAQILSQGDFSIVGMAHHEALRGSLRRANGQQLN